MLLANAADAAVVRTLAVHDLNALLALYTELHPEDPPVARDLLEQTFARMLASSFLVQMGVFAADTLVSTAQAVIVPNLTRGARPYAIIENVGTAHAHKRRGYGALCIQALVAHCWDAGCYKVSLTSGVSRAAEAHLFYDALGFDRHAKTAFVLTRPGCG